MIVVVKSCLKFQMAEVRWVPLNNYQKMCYKWFGRAAESVVTEKMKDNLERAHITIRPGAYISCIWVNTILAAIVSTVVYLSLIIFFCWSSCILISRISPSPTRPFNFSGDSQTRSLP